MKKIIGLIVLFMLLISCSAENEVISEKPDSPKQVLVEASKRKSAINVFLKTNTTGKSTAEPRKKLVKSISYMAENALNRKFKINMTMEQYYALGTDNIYDKKEDTLNLNSKVYEERTFTYNADNNLEKISINNIAYPDYNTLDSYKPIIFEYETNGTKKLVSRYQDNGMIMKFEYNAIGQIIKAFNIQDDLLYTYDYDEQGNIFSKYAYLNNKKIMHYTYVYYPNNTYDKNWISVDVDGTEKITSTVNYTFDRSVEGVYQNNQIYKATSDNQEGLQYLHIISNSAGYRPKYFYDADGYLIKYDKGGVNDTNDITIFKYE